MRLALFAVAAQGAFHSRYRDPRSPAEDQAGVYTPDRLRKAGANSIFADGVVDAEGDGPDAGGEPPIPRLLFTSHALPLDRMPREIRANIDTCNAGVERPDARRSNAAGGGG